MTNFLAKGFLLHELGAGLKQILNRPVQGIPVIIVTAEDLLVAVGGTIEAGAVTVLQKPVYQNSSCQRCNKLWKQPDART